MVPPYLLAHDPNELTRLGETPQPGFRKHQRAVDPDLENTVGRRDQRDLADVFFILGQQGFRLTDGAQRIASLEAVGDADRGGGGLCHYLVPP